MHAKKRGILSGFKQPEFAVSGINWINQVVLINMLSKGQLKSIFYEVFEGVRKSEKSKQSLSRASGSNQNWEIFWLTFMDAPLQLGMFGLRVWNESTGNQKNVTIPKRRMVIVMTQSFSIIIITNLFKSTLPVLTSSWPASCLSYECTGSQSQPKRTLIQNSSSILI